jgi:hypothetical protein
MPLKGSFPFYALPPLDVLRRSSFCRFPEAVIHMGEALRIQPGHADAVRYYEHARQEAALAVEDSGN